MDKQLSQKYEKLVSNATEFLKALPWGPGEPISSLYGCSKHRHLRALDITDFEVEVFKKPDFTALDVVSFATGGEWLCA